MQLRTRLIHYLLWLTIGLIVGAGIGLFLGWVAWPLEITDADPTVLEERYQREYALMIASAYSLDGDLAAAEKGLEALGKSDPDRWLLAVTVDQILNGRDDRITRHLVMMVKDLGLDSPVMEQYLASESEEASP